MKTTADLAPEPAVWGLAADVLPEGKAYDWNQALMDLGAMVCTATRPRCNGCPVEPVCRSRATMMPARSRRSARREAKHRGTPLRQYRGRVIEALRRAHPRRSVSALQLGRSILPEFTERDRQVFNRVLRGLERDGLVELARNRQAIPERIALA
jgi:A/G-specific adenine glycosylase